MPDTGTPLCTYAQLTEGPFGDLFSDETQTVASDFLLEATRIIEDECGRRLAPFTVTEYHRAEGIDPDEYADAANLPMDIRSELGASYASAIGAQNLVRHCWVDEKASRYQDMWQYSGVTINVIRSYGGTQAIQPAQILSGPEPDTGHIWFQLGLFMPVGSRVQVTYSGGYNPVPASLVRANKFMAAYLMIRELQPEASQHDPEQLYTDAMLILANWKTEG